MYALVLTTVVTYLKVNNLNRSRKLHIPWIGVPGTQEKPSDRWIYLCPRQTGITWLKATLGDLTACEDQSLEGDQTGTYSVYRVQGCISVTDVSSRYV